MKQKDKYKRGRSEAADPEVGSAGAPVEETSSEAAAPVDGQSAPEAGEADAAQQAATEAGDQPPSEEAKLRDRLVRLQADFDNYRKRIARDHAEMVSRANADLLEALLPVLDHFGHAEASMEKDARSDIAAYLQGFRLVRDELVRVLDSFGVKPIEAVGRPFDATVHDALSIMPSETAEPGTVLFEIRKGYTLNGRVLRPAQVVVVAEREAQAAPMDAVPPETPKTEA